MVKAGIVFSIAIIAAAAGLWIWTGADAAEGRVTQSLGWMLDPQSTLSPDSRSVDVLYLNPPCGETRNLRTKVEYKATEIAVGLSIDYWPNCLMGPGAERAHITLGEPLGNRTVVPLDEPTLTLEQLYPTEPPRPTPNPAFQADPRL
jgi:hypothetical protein